MLNVSQKDLTDLVSRYTGAGRSIADDLLRGNALPRAFTRVR